MIGALDITDSIKELIELLKAMVGGVGDLIGMAIDLLKSIWGFTTTFFKAVAFLLTEPTLVLFVLITFIVLVSLHKTRSNNPVDLVVNLGKYTKRVFEFVFQFFMLFISLIRAVRG
jgi:hypothetical protein